MTHPILGDGLSLEDQKRLADAWQRAQGSPSGPALSGEQYIAGGADQLLQQAQWASVNSRRAIRNMTSERDGLLASIAERDILVGKAADAIEQLSDENESLKAELAKLRKSNGKTRKP